MLCGPPSPGPCQQPCEDPGSSLLGPCRRHAGTQPHSPAHQQQPHAPMGHTANHTGRLHCPAMGLPPPYEAWLHSPPSRGQPPYQCALRSLPKRNRRLYTVHIGSTPRAYSSGDQRGLCCWDPQDVSYVRLLLQDCKTQLTHLMHRNKENSAKMFQMKEQDKNLRKRSKQSGDRQST